VKNEFKSDSIPQKTRINNEYAKTPLVCLDWIGISFGVFGLYVE